MQSKDAETSTKSQKVVIGKEFAILDTLSPYATYSIKIQAFNGKGESLWSLLVVNKTAESGKVKIIHGGAILIKSEAMFE